MRSMPATGVRADCRASSAPRDWSVWLESLDWSILHCLDLRMPSRATSLRSTVDRFPPSATDAAVTQGLRLRAGIQAVDNGQREAAAALGLPENKALRLVVIPQALRVIIPPLTSQYLNLTKNSSLAVAIAYPDIVSVFAGTTLTQVGQAVEIIFITMMVYLTLSLLTSWAMNRYNARMALVGQNA